MNRYTIWKTLNALSYHVLRMRERRERITFSLCNFSIGENTTSKKRSGLTNFFTCSVSSRTRLLISKNDDAKQLQHLHIRT
ncbi:hypothetical protein POVCU1_019100 [Plasmodium ovale curtisi]|uniref:Uncharacterized protein n=1 Tax=Plasmodium ovale curtisi TaxID=864141 RepID=A0A1A8WFH5_PLAOA|nr:hypothetical protein POVCU1_019100 [Plasmodium ovale curtisi]